MWGFILEHIIIIIVAAAVSIAAATAMFLYIRPRFGRLPQGQRKIRVEHSPNYRNGQFRNQEPTVMMTGRKNATATMVDYLLAKKNHNLRPEIPIESVDTDFKSLDMSKDQIVWLGHSALLIVVKGRSILVDPTLVDGAPFRFLNKPFEYVNEFSPDDMPVIDCLLITHDHWDHLDYTTIKKLHNKIISIVCPLGVGEHFEYWGFENDQINELDWWQSVRLWDNINITATPARHFSGRGFTRNKSLWSSFVIESDNNTIFIGGDSGYGIHFAEIGSRFKKIDMAVIENGQYNENWANIHTMPQCLGYVINDLKPSRVLTVHHSRYALSMHPWNEPLENAKSLRDIYGEHCIIIPNPGEIIDL